MLKNLKTKVGQIVKNKLSFRVFWLFTLLFTFTFGILSPSVIPFAENSQYIAYAADPKVLAPKVDPKDDDKIAAADIQKPSPEQVGLAEVISMLVSIATPAVVMMTNLCGKLLNNDWIYGKAGSVDATNEMSEVLHNMWIIMRDIVNILFIIVLLAIAFVTVLGAGTPLSEKLNYKTLLPKLAIALVVVNFTWFGAKIIIDASTVATHAVFGLFQTVVKNNLNLSEVPMCIPNGIEFSKEVNDMNITEDYEGTQPTSKEKHEALKDKINKSDTIDCEKDMPLRYPKFTVLYWESSTVEINKDMNAGTLMKLFSYGIWHIETLPMSVDTNVTITNLAINLIFAFAFMIMIMIVMFVLLVALFVRILMLWLNIVFSPIFALLWVIGDMGLSMDNENIGFKPFVTFAFLPAMIAFPMVIGMLMIMAGKSMTPITSTIDEEVKQLKITEVINGINSVDQLLWYLMALIVMWGSTTVATKFGGELTKAVVEPVKSGVVGLTKAAGKSLAYMPFIPAKSADGKENMQVGIGNYLDGIKRMPGEWQRGRDKTTGKLMGFDMPSYDKLKGDIGKLAENLSKDDAQSLMTMAGETNNKGDLITKMVNVGGAIKELGIGLRDTPDGKTQDMGQLLDVLQYQKKVERDSNDGWGTGGSAGTKSSTTTEGVTVNKSSSGESTININGTELKDKINIEEINKSQFEEMAKLAGDSERSQIKVLEELKDKVSDEKKLRTTAENSGAFNLLEKEDWDKIFKGDSGSSTDS